MRRQMIVVRHFGTQICNFHLAMGFMLGFQFLCLIWSVLSLGKSFFFSIFPGCCGWASVSNYPVMRHQFVWSLCRCITLSRDTGTLLSCIIQLRSNDGEHNTTMIQTRYNQHFHTMQLLWHGDHVTWVSAAMKTAQGSTPGNWHRVTMSQCLSRQIISNI